MKSNKTKKYIVTYTVNSPFGSKLEIIESANAWWMNREKLHRLMAAFSVEATIPEACFHAEITEKQYKYFLKRHPSFREIRGAYSARNALQARITLMKGIESNPKLAMKYLEKKLPEEFGRPSRLKSEVDARKERMVKLTEIQEAMVKILSEKNTDSPQSDS